MIKEKKVEHLENSSVRLSVTIEQESAAREYKTLLQTYSKKAHIKGFRPGKVPVNILESKFGESLRMETAQKLIDDTLKTLFDEIEEKPLGYASPELDGELAFDPASDFSYAVKYDIFPKVEVKTAKGLTIEEPQVKIEKEDLDRELESLREQNALVVEKNDIAIEKGNIVTVDTIELDEQSNEIPETEKTDLTITLGSSYNQYNLDDDLVGMKVGEEKIITNKESGEEEEDRTTLVKVTVKKIKVKELPDLDDELAQDIDEEFQTLADLKKSIQTRLEDSAASQVRSKKVNSLVDQLVEKNPLVVPQSMVDAELHANWKNFLRQFGGNEAMIMQLLQAQGSSQAQLFEEWRPDAEKRLKGQLIIQKLIEEENLEASDEEVTEEISKQAKGSSMSDAEAREYFEKNNLIDYVQNDIKERKLFDKLFEMNTIKKGEKVKYLDLMQQNR